MTVGQHEIGASIQFAPGVSFTIVSATVSEELSTGSSGQPLQDVVLLQILFENSSKGDAVGPELRVTCTGVVGNRIAFGSGSSYDPSKRLAPGRKFEGYSVVSYPRYCDDGLLAGVFPDGIRMNWVLPPRE